MGAYVAGLARQPLARMLLLSLAVHASFMLGIRPRPGGLPVETTVISARLIEPPRSAIVPEPVEAHREDTPPDAPPPAPPKPGYDPVPATGAAAPVPAPPGAPIREATTAAPAPASQPEPSRAPAPPDDSPLPSVPVMLDTNWYQARQLDLQPKARQAIVPDYPMSARRAGQEGHVILIVRIDELGDVKDVKIESANPPGVFDDSARAAFERGRFVPARLAGRPVRAEIRIRVTYQLND